MPIEDALFSGAFAYFPILCGLFFVIGTLLDTDWFMNIGRIGETVDLVGRNWARGCFFFVGISFIMFGLLISLAI